MAHPRKLCGSIRWRKEISSTILELIKLKKNNNSLLRIYNSYLYENKMEKRLNKKFEMYIGDFKNNIRDQVKLIEFTDENDTQKMNELVAYIYDYERLVYSKEDISKRKRVKNSVPQENRCNAKRSSGEQCTRRRKDVSEYCGAHIKGTPHGIFNDEGDNETTMVYNVNVFAKEIGGIVYYIDERNNVYNTEDVMSGKQNPAIIAKYEKNNDRYSISEFGII